MTSKWRFQKRANRFELKPIFQNFLTLLLWAYFLTTFCGGHPMPPPVTSALISRVTDFEGSLWIFCLIYRHQQCFFLCIIVIKEMSSHLKAFVSRGNHPLIMLQFWSHQQPSLTPVLLSPLGIPYPLFTMWPRTDN